MKRTLIVTTGVAASSLFLSLGANAQTAAQAKSHMSLGEIAVMLESQGYTIREIELERNGYEVKMSDAKGMRIKAYLNRVTGAVQPYQKSHHRYRCGDDDCYDDD